jgi:Fis family transcriptional regulator
MSQQNQNIEQCVRDSLEGYFRDLGGETRRMYDMLVRLVEKPLLEVVMQPGRQQPVARAPNGWA